MSNNYQDPRYEDHEVARLPICWRCGKVGHKKDCTKILNFTNCGKNNQITSCCRQPFEDTCKYCKQMRQREEECPHQQRNNLEKENIKKIKPIPTYRSRTPTLLNRAQFDQKNYQFNYTNVPNFPTVPKTQNYEVY